MCLDCQPSTGQLWDTVDFCGHPDCNRFILANTEKPHLVTHDFVKLHTILHRRDMPRFHHSVKTALNRARLLWKPLYTPSLSPVIVDSPRALMPRDRRETSSEHIHDLANEVSQIPHSPPISPVIGPAHSPSYNPLQYDPFQRNAPPVCNVCKKDLLQPCWFCVSCFTSSGRLRVSRLL